MGDKVAVLIDGFNFYHAISAHIKSVCYPKNFKWLDYDSLVRNILLKTKNIEVIESQFKLRDEKLNFIFSYIGGFIFCYLQKRYLWV